MNIRGTDPTALSAVTDLFVTPSTARDGSAPDFQRALSPPPKPSAPAQSAPSRDTTKRDAPTKSNQPADGCRAADQHSDHDDTTDETTTTAADGNDQPVAQNVDKTGKKDAEAPAAEDAQETSKDAAAALAVAAAAVVEKPLPEQKATQINPELTGETTAAEEEAAPAEEPATGIIAQPAVGETLVAATATELSVTQKVAAGTEAIAEVAVGEEPTEPATAEGSEQPAAGIGVMPSALQSQATTTAKANAARTSPAKSAVTTDDRAKHLKATGDTKTSEATPEATSVETDLAAAAAPANDAEDKGERKSKELELPSLTTPLTPAVPPPSEVAAAVDLKVETSTPPAAEAPAVPDLQAGQQQQAPDTAKLTTTQPLANQAITQRLPAHAVMRTTPQQPTPPPLHVDAARFLQRVSKAFEVASERGGEIRLRLSPPELGALRVEVNMSEHGLAARVEVENSDARAILLENLPALRERLAEQGMKLEKFDVDLSQREPDQQMNQQFSDQPRDRNPARETRPMITAVKTTSSTPTTTNSTPTSGWQDRQLNVIV
ncbi:flagellar hook-length control protein FliK [Anatilimnocola floriformis]|uniref:flagellar hook-length control protein FliK n=1 Tax=Anatilimnocola floriformis TaxID=2948575 RepID=UPI0020C2A163|nr:flagellar hook-length control protein FliK [Anatilimnocola floriformis]